MSRENTPLLGGERTGSKRFLYAKMAVGAVFAVAAIVIFAWSGPADTPVQVVTQAAAPVKVATTSPTPSQTADPNAPLAEWAGELMEPPFPKETNLIVPKLHSPAWKGAIPSNAWWTNFLIADGHGEHLGEGQVTLTPYTVIGLSSGLQVSYGDDRRVGDNAIIQEYFADDLVFSSNPAPNTRQVVWFDSLNVRLEFKRQGHAGTFTALLARGSPYMSVNYKGLVPKLSLGGSIGAITMCAGEAIGSTAKTFTGTQFHFHTRIERNLVQEWLVFFPTNVTLLVDAHTATVQATTFSGIVRAAILPQGEAKASYKALVRQLSNTVPVATSIKVGTAGDTGAVSFAWQTKLMAPNATGDNDLLMLAFPHHVDAFGDLANANVTSVLDTRPDIAPAGALKVLGAMGHRTLKGNLTAVVGAAWTLVEPLTKVGFFSPRPIDPRRVHDISAALDKDAAYRPSAADPYFFGKEVARQARLILIADQVHNLSVRDSLVAKVEGWLTRWLTLQNSDFFVYDTVWGGVCSNTGLKGVFYMTDFGNGWYNDHHFHYGYFLYSAAVLGRYRPEFLQRHKAALFTIVRDIANFNPHDVYFPLARHMSWFDGHSFASGVYVLDGGKSQESVSEAINAYYGVYLLGQVLEMPRLEQFGRVLLAMEMRAAQTYWQTKPEIYGELYAKNQMTGQVGQTKATYATWFGPVIEHMHLINFIPFTPITEEFFSPEYVQKEYQVLYDGAVARKENPMEEIWRGYAFLDHAIIDPAAAWNEVQTLKTYDDGNSRSNSLYWIATRPTP
ncbi:endo-1,3(4)-beta-glucanase [Achlya hypogyna]|uniref:glucan endo-1,3-beta-D-glucosidase n=1 Tax=Achlya hypogyna TaxID=1202772 RepID=A0A1V9YNU8_ACHHY|nr:endo-1,3(4)-beta-glucanase [Achlya hypogyna]